MRPHGRAQVSSKNPQAFAICDRCGFLYNHKDLGWQYDWGGASLINKRILVCNPCMDEAQEQLRAIVLPPDPVPIVNPRTENYAAASTNFLLAQTPASIDPTTGLPIPQGNIVTGDEGNPIIGQPVGAPLGLQPGAIMPLNGVAIFDVPILAISITSYGTNVITVTCQGPHNLQTNDQIAIYGTSDPRTMGFFSVDVVTATVFRYSIVPFISSGSYLLPDTRIATCSVGIPYDMEQVPIIGIATGLAATPYFWVNNQGQPIYFTNDGGEILYWNFPQ